MPPVSSLNHILIAGADIEQTREARVQTMGQVPLITFRGRESLSPATSPKFETRRLYHVRHQLRAVNRSLRFTDS